jgi:ribonuclease D
MNTHSSDGLPSTPGDMIRTPAELADCCSRLAKEKCFGFDTEFIGENTYLPIVCLIQVATPSHVDLIDPLAVHDLTPLMKLLADPDIMKICHAGEQDLAIVYQLGKEPPANVMDTQVLAGMIGIGYPLSYGRLVEYLCGIALEKAHTYSAWDRRPLTKAQFHYAVDDVRYLPSIYDAIDRKLTGLNRRHWAQQACAELCQSAGTPPDPQKAYLKIKTPRSMNPMQIAVLRDLAAWREQAAFEHNVPARSFIPDSVIKEIARQLPTKKNNLERIEDFPGHELKSYGDFIIHLVDKIKAASPQTYPHPSLAPDDHPDARAFGDALWVAAQAICLGQSVCTPLVASQNDIQLLADGIASGKKLDGHEFFSGWRYECLGQKLLDFAQGRSDLTLKCDGWRMTLS